jgi:uncharacterized membrane protein YdjX (TVP38/TMEM64 family)
LAGLWLYREPLLELIALARDRDALAAHLETYGQAGLIFIFVILALQVLIAAIPGHLMMLVSGYLYGFLTAFLVTHASTVMASQLAYHLARRFGRPIVDRLAPADLAEKWTREAERQGMVFFFISFMVPIFPSDVMNFVAGLSGLSSRKFLTANFFGRLPTSLLFALIGAQGFQITPLLIVAAIVYTGLMLTAWRVVAPRLRKQA